MPGHRVRTCTSHHHISCVKVSFYPSIPKRGGFFRTNVSHSSLWYTRQRKKGVKAFKKVKQENG